MFRKLTLALALLTLSIPAYAQRVIGTITSGSGAANVVVLNPNPGAQTVFIGIQGTWVATNIIEYLAQNSTTWATLKSCINLSSTAAITSTTINVDATCVNIAFQSIRVRASAFTSGTVTVTLDAVNSNAVTGVNFGGGSATIGAVTQGAASDSSNNWTVNCAVGCSSGTLTNNNAAPSSNHLASLTSIANAAAPSWSEGNEVLASSNLLGDLRTISKQSGTWNVGTVTTLTGITNALPAGGNVLGKVSTDQTSHGTTDLTASDITKVGGSALALGTATAANSIPVALPTATITTLTPPSNTNYSTTTKQSDGSQKTQIVDGSGNVISSTTNSLNVNCTAGCTSTGGTSATDNAAVTESSSTFTPFGGEFLTTPGTVTTGHQAMAAITAHRALQVSLFDTSGNAVTLSPIATTNTTAQTTGIPVFGIGSSSAPSAVTTGNNVGEWYDLNGRVHVTGDASMSKLLVTPDANSTVNVAQLNGTTTDTNSGTKSAGTLRVVLATDQPQLTAKLLVTPDANSAVNVAQINGVTVLMNNGTTGTGSQRVTVASDNSPVSGFAVGATGSAVPANAVYQGANNQAGALIGDTFCDKAKIYDTNTNGSTELVAISGSTHVYICGFTLFSAGTVNVGLTAGTGTACASAASGANNVGTSGAAAKLTPSYQLTTQTGLKEPIPTHGYLFDAGSANAVCLNTSAGVSVQAEIWYAQR